MSAPTEHQWKLALDRLQGPPPNERAKFLAIMLLGCVAAPDAAGPKRQRDEAFDGSRRA
jgi:hypothetical protein